MSRTTKRNLIVIVVAVLLAVFLTTLIGTLSNGYENITDPGVWGKERNPDNLILSTAKNIKCTDGSVAGTIDIDDYYDIKVNSLGVVSIEGENDDDTDHYIVIWSSDELEAGTYTFDCEDDGDFKGDVLVCKESVSSYAVLSGDTITVTAGETYAVIVKVPQGQEIDATFEPVLVKGFHPPKGGS